MRQAFCSSLCVWAILTLMPAGAPALAGEVPVLTVYDCAGAVTTYQDPAPGESLIDLSLDACPFFQRWQVTSGEALVDTLNPSLMLLVELSGSATVEAVCTGFLTVLDCDGQPVADYTCPEPGLTEVRFDPPQGREFALWQIVAGQVELDTLSNPTFLIAPLLQDATIQAQCLTLRKLTVVNGTATTAPRQPGGYYLPDQIVGISADIPAGATFTGWTADIPSPQFGDASQPDTTIKMTADMTVTATYTQAGGETTYWKLTVVNGTALTPPAQAGGLYAAGTVVEIAASVPAGATFIGWTADVANPQFGDATQANTTIKMTAHMTVTAHSIEIPPSHPDRGSGCTNDSGVYDAVPQSLAGQILGGLSITNAPPNTCFDWAMTQDDMSAADAPGPDAGTLAGLQIGYGRTFTITATGGATGFTAMVSIRLTAAELAVHAVSPADLALFRLDPTQTPAPGAWVPAGTNLGPAAPTTTVGNAGYIQMGDGSVSVWAVLDQVGVFAVGQPTSAGPPVEPTEPTEPGEPVPTEDGGEVVPPACGACGLGAGPATLFCALAWSIARLAGTRRRPRGR